MSDNLKVFLGALGGAVLALLLVAVFFGGGTGGMSSMMGGGMMGGGMFGALSVLLFWMLVIALSVALRSLVREPVALALQRRTGKGGHSGNR